tara:strand:- start:536 stop:1849 length:1314 start_codon:yes stop_codon:yes gene_type:complete
MPKRPDQIITDNIPYNYDEVNLNSYLYKLTNLITKMKYLGIKKGVPDYSYLFSSEDPTFLKDFMDPNSKWHLDVLMYNTYEYVQAKEQQMLREVNARDNPEYYNKSNGGSDLVLPNMNLLKHLVEEIKTTGAYNGTLTTLLAVRDLPKHRIQVRNFTYDSKHISTLKSIINERTSLKHLRVIILKNRLYRGRKGDLVIDGNHSIAAAEKSKFGLNGQIPVVALEEDQHKDIPDDDIDIVAVMFNPSVENPTLESDDETIAGIVKNMMIRGLNPSSKEVQDLYDQQRLTRTRKAKVTTIAKEMYNREWVPNTSTWIRYDAGDEKKNVQSEISKECVLGKENRATHGGIFSKCYSTAKFNPWADLFSISIWNRDNPKDLIHTYKVRWWHADKDYKDTWIKKWKTDNEFVIDDLLGIKNIKIDWSYLPETRDKFSTKGGE